MPILHQGRAFHPPSIGKLTPLDNTFDPCPTPSCPQLEQDALCRAFFPLTCIERHGLVPVTRWYGWANSELLATGYSFFASLTPFLKMSGKRACRAKSRMNG